MLQLLCFVLFGVLQVYGQFQSPCPNNFEYKVDEKGVYGLMRVQPKCQDAQLLTKLSFTVASRLPSSYVGSIKPLGDYAVNNCANNKTIEYRVNFPLSNPIPRITMISANDNVICKGPGDEMDVPNRYVSSIDLEHEIYFKTSNSAEYHQQTVHKKVFTPEIVYEEHAYEHKYNVTYNIRS